MLNFYNVPFCRLIEFDNLPIRVINRTINCAVSMNPLSDVQSFYEALRRKYSNFMSRVPRGGYIHILNNTIKSVSSK